MIYLKCGKEMTILKQTNTKFVATFFAVTKFAAVVFERCSRVSCVPLIIPKEVQLKTKIIIRFPPLHCLASCVLNTKT